MKSHRVGPSARVVLLPKRTAQSHPSASSVRSRLAWAEWGRHRFRDSRSCSPAQESHSGATCSVQVRRPRLQGWGAMSRTMVKAVFCGPDSCPGLSLVRQPSPGHPIMSGYCPGGHWCHTNCPTCSPTRSEAALVPQSPLDFTLITYHNLCPFVSPWGGKCELGNGQLTSPIYPFWRSEG